MFGPGKPCRSQVGRFSFRCEFSHLRTLTHVWENRNPAFSSDSVLKAQFRTQTGMGFAT
jgi:hypothetical protein